MKIEAFEQFNELELIIANWRGEAIQVEDTWFDDLKEYFAIFGVINNRIKDSRWPNDIKQVILAKNQFSWTRTTTQKEREYGEIVWTFTKNKGTLYRKMEPYAVACVEGRVKDFSDGSDHYIAEWAYRGRSGTNHWSQQYTVRSVYGGHIFLKS